MAKTKNKIKKLLSKKGYHGKIKEDITLNYLDIIHWLIKEKRILVTVDYEYEFDFTSYYYKIYNFVDKYGKPEQQPIFGERYDNENRRIVEIVSYRDYRRSHINYSTYLDALEEGILDALKISEMEEDEE